MKATSSWVKGSRLSKIAVLFIITLFVVTPLSPVFAQVADPTLPQADTITTPAVDTTTSSDNSSIVPLDVQPVSEDVSNTDATPTDTTTTDLTANKDASTDKLLAPQIQSLAIGVPPENANKKLADINLPNIDKATGTLQYKFPIVVPPGRGSMTPDVALTYNSQEKRDGILGVGWSTNILYIERLPKKGTERMFTDNYFKSSMDGELVNISGTAYGPKVENGQFLKYAFSSNSWTVTDKNGTVYKFGNQAATRLDNPSDSTKVFRWMLEETRDTNNNYITYEYYKNGGQIYPSKITYTGNGSTAGIFTVNFDRVSRTNVFTSYTTGFAITTNYKISQIRTEVSTVWAKKYDLAYTTADNGISLLLDTITESGQDDSGVTTTLPVVNFDYKTSTPGWTFNSNTTLRPPHPFIQGSSVDIGERFADINGDGLADVLCHNGNSSPSTNCNSSNPEIWLNTGTSFVQSSTWQLPYIAGATSGPREAFTGTTYGDTGLRLVDVNGDGLTDLVRGLDSFNYVYLNNGTSGWTYQTWGLPEPFILSSKDFGVRLADINGDGLVDLICHNLNNSANCGTNAPEIWLNTGTGWTATSAWQLPLIAGAGTIREGFVDSSYRDTGLRIIDLNGDGLPDLVDAYGSIHVYWNNGNGWTYDSAATLIPPYGFISGVSDIGERTADINNDGLPDDLCHNKSTIGNCKNSEPTISTNNTITIAQNNAWQFPLAGGVGYPEAFTDNYYADTGLRIIDLDGDGMLDLVSGKDPNTYVYFSNNSFDTNLLTKITYPQGGSTDITYKATGKFTVGSGTIANPNLPTIIDVVSQVTNNDGLGNSNTRTYSYEGGKYYYTSYLDRKFSGFAKVTDTDGAGNVTKTYYHQGDASDSTHGEYNDDISKAGQTYRTEVYDNASHLYSKTINKWDKYNLGTGRDFVKLAQSVISTYDGDSTHKDKAEAYTYDNTYGNMTQKVAYGEVTGADDGTFTDTGTDLATENISYVANTTNYVVGLPYQDTLLDQSSGKVRESKTYYDTLSLGTVGAGNPTKVEQWVTGSTYINSQKAYNTTYGIVTSDTDPRGKVTGYAYDTNNLYPATITDPLTHTTQYVYDYSFGKPKQVTDQNGFVYNTTYDGLDRVTEQKIPGSIMKTTYAYTDTSGAVAIHKVDYLDSSTNADTYQYFDGLGRLIQERKEAETSGTFNVKDTAYNNIGLKLKESLPYTSSGSSKTSATGTSSLYANYTYDPVQRPLTVSNAVGTTSYAYSDWKTTITDANNKVKNYYKDAYDNLIKVEEINGGSTYTTNYIWNLNNKLTKITDALSNIRNFTYDGLGRRLTAEDLHASGDGTFGTWTYVYDDAGNITQTVSPNSLTTNYTYNDVNQILTEDYTGVAGTEITYTYSGCTNGIGKLCSVTMTSGADTSYTYDSNGNVASEVKTINSTPYTTSYTYDRQGNKLIITYPDSAQVKYTFNTAGLLEKIETKESGGTFTDVISNFDYSPVDQVTTQADVNNVTTTNTYDSTHLYRLTRRLTQNTVPTKFQDLNYTYDNVGNITQIIDASNTNSSKTANYIYDDLYRLTSATITAVASGQSTYTHTFTYDAVGNISTGPIGSYTYAGTGYANPHAATTINGVAYSYDNDGNLTGNGTLANTWNYKDQLTQAVVGAVASAYTYDHTGERATLANGTTTTVYPNDYYNTDGAKITKEIYDNKNNLIATTETVSGTVTPYYDHIDQLGSVTTTTDSTGVLVDTLDYFPYGNQRIQTGPTSERQYVGQIYDQDTGLNYLNARMFKADVGRFISEDPSFLALGDEQKTKAITGKSLTQMLSDPQSYSSYSYARNNPITLSDPEGKYWEVSASGTALAWSGAIGIRFDSSGLDVFAAGGFGTGIEGKPLSLSYTPGQLSHATETNMSIGGSASAGLGYGVSYSGVYQPNTYSIQNPSRQQSFILTAGAGAEVYARKEVSVPVFGAQSSGSGSTSALYYNNPASSNSVYTNVSKPSTTSSVYSVVKNAVKSVVKSIISVFR